METAETTQLLRAGAGGDAGALAQLTPRLYPELRRLARHFLLDERRGRTIQTTALVNEAYLRLVDVACVDWQHRAHFIGLCAEIMRHILVDAARKRRTRKRGGSMIRLDLDAAANLPIARDRDLIALDDALQALANVDSRRARVIELRFFGGLSVKETAQVLEVSQETVMRDWKLARAWLLVELDRS